MNGKDDIFRPGDTADELGEEVLEDFGDDIISVVDEDGKEHVFEELDRVDLDFGSFVALAPLVGEEDEDGDDEVIILRVEEEEGEICLSILEDEAEFDKVARVFSERLGIPLDL
ncbi:MAG: DUF1292 domain-containing protein [Oscillospiraceae bacterium]|nr:DUF1292 domain-containing protein [Oscillospiraceae bacterium]